MGYQTSLHLIDIKIDSQALDQNSSPTRKRKPVGRDSLPFFLKRATVDCNGFLQFTASEDDLDPYVPCEDDNTVPALYGKWGTAEDIATWLKEHAVSPGRMVLHSCEGDGEAWGWEFDGKGRMRALALHPIGKWE